MTVHFIATTDCIIHKPKVARSKNLKKNLQNDNSVNNNSVIRKTGVRRNRVDYSFFFLCLIIIIYYPIKNVILL